MSEIYDLFSTKGLLKFVAIGRKNKDKWELSQFVILEMIN